MTPEMARGELVRSWMSKAGEALDSAQAEAAAGRNGFAVNRAYYACFYAASAVLLQQDRQFVKHSGLRAALHQHLVKPGLLDESMGKEFDDLFRKRHSADYDASAVFDGESVVMDLRNAEAFVAAASKLLIVR